MKDKRPKYNTIKKTVALFQPSVKTWSNLTVTWSDTSNLWGGSDMFSDKGPNNKNVLDVKPL